jgi:hypothetical protein
MIHQPAVNSPNSPVQQENVVAVQLALREVVVALGGGHGNELQLARGVADLEEPAGRVLVHSGVVGACVSLPGERENMHREKEVTPISPNSTEETMLGRQR